MKFILNVFDIMFCKVNRVLASGQYETQVDLRVCLKLGGEITNHVDGDDWLIELISNKYGVTTTVLSEGRNKFDFILAKDLNYGIRISKEGYISKLVCIDTWQVTEKDKIYNFNFEVQMVKQPISKSLRSNFIEFPVGSIFFDPEQDSFCYRLEQAKKLNLDLFKQNPSLN